MLTKEDSKTFGRSFAKLLLELGEVPPAYDWPVLNHSNSKGAIKKPSYPRAKPPTWPFPQPTQSSKATSPSKRMRPDL